MSMACPSCVVSLAVPTLGFAAGRMLGGYRIKQFLGSGGFGEREFGGAEFARGDVDV